MYYILNLVIIGCLAILGISGYPGWASILAFFAAGLATGLVIASLINDLD